jgi:hypothetical protein
VSRDTPNSGAMRSTNCLGARPSGAATALGYSSDRLVAIAERVVVAEETRYLKIACGRIESIAVDEGQRARSAFHFSTG